VAGRRAAAAAARVLVEKGVEAAVVVLPTGQDPDDMIRGQGDEAFRELVENPQSLLEFLLADLPDEPALRRRAGLKLAPMVCSARNPATRRNMIYELARLVDLSPAELEEYGRSPHPTDTPKSAPARPATAPGERNLARILVECSHDWRQRILEVIRVDLIQDTRVRRVVELVSELHGEGEPGEQGGQGDLIHRLVSSCADTDLEGFVAQLCTSEMPDITDDMIHRQIRALVQFQAREGARRLRPLIEDAERRGDQEELARLMAEKARLRQNTPGF
jgi:DNA primase